MKPAYALLAYALLSAASAAPAAAQNLLVNPDFATDLEPWAPFNYFGLSVVWSPLDAAGDPDSGSVEGTVPMDGTFRLPPYVVQCVTVAPDTAYTVGAKVLLPSATADPSAYAFVHANAYPNEGCFGNASTTLFGTSVTTFDAWTEVRSGIVTGPEERSLQINLRVFAPTDTLLRSYFDDALLLPDTLFADGFDD